MMWFNGKIVKMIRKSGTQNFKFEKEKTKLHLMQSIIHTPMKEKKQEESRPWFVLPKLKLGIALASVLILLTGTFAYADSAKPGDKLFGLDKLQERMVLKLPLPAEKKARVEARIVNERALELKQIHGRGNENELKARAIRESKESLNNAIDHVTQNKIRLEARGKMERAKRLGGVLNQLEDLASEQEQKADDIRKEIMDKRLGEEIEQEIREIQRAKIRARLEIDRKIDNIETKTEIETQPETIETELKIAP